MTYDAKLLHDLVNQRYLETGGKLPARYVFYGFFNTGDTWMDAADNEDELAFSLKRILSNPTIGDVVLVNKYGQLLWSRYGGRTNVDAPKYFDKYFESEV